MAAATVHPSASEPSLSADLTTPPASHSADDDQAMSDDVKVAISALGLLSEGALGPSSSGDEGRPPLPPGSSLPHHPSTPEHPSFPPPSTSRHHSRTASSPHRSDPSRSTSTASTASASEAWTTPGGTSSTGASTGFSSPVGTTSVFCEGGGHDDADMSERGLGEAELDGQDEEGQHQDPKFMARVSQLPYVSGGLEWYERSKASSRVVKLGADLVESSFSAVSRPITNNVQLGGLDDFACRQLDRIGAPGSSPGRKSPLSAAAAAQEEEARGRSSETTPVKRGGEGEMLPPETSLQQQQQQRTSSTSGAGGQVATVSQRSRWQTVLLEAGGLGAAVSEESLKSLRYCLQWLLYATAHLDHQIATLRDFILSLRAHNRHSSSSSSHALVAASASAHLSQIKHDVVETIRKVVEVVSKYAGAALPEQAKRYVRQSILGLPVKWASAIEGRPGGPVSAAARRRQRERSGSVGGLSVVASESEVGTPRPERMHESYFSGAAYAEYNGNRAVEGQNGERLSAGEDGEQQEGDGEMSPTEEAADRVLTFAVESLEMLRSVTGIFGESVEKAEAWIERLRIVGLDRQRQRQAAAAAAGEHARQQQQHPFPLPSASSSSVINPAAYALPPSGPASVSTSPTLSSSATFDDTASGVGTKRRRASTRGGEDGVNGSGAVTTGTDVGGVTDGEGEGLGRRKRGAR
ncbi:hypothetical protein JCM11251_002605 [Rhodosporidiobolus azoricus]